MKLEWEKTKSSQDDIDDLQDKISIILVDIKSRS